MCYNFCDHFKFNNLKGEGRCNRGKNPCPVEICEGCLEVECVCEDWEKDDVSEAG